MKILLIRHGETVDNVAHVYAGIKDSALTVHGSLQAERLGIHLAARGITFTKIFSSDLQRAIRTADALHAAQLAVKPDPNPRMIQLPALREQDFGFYEGKPFYARPRSSNKSGKEVHRDQHLDDVDFKDAESKETMTARTDAFIFEHLRALILEEASNKEAAVAIVSHGIILSHLWRSLLGCFAKGTVSLAPGLSVGNNGVTPLEHLGGWSNTGFLELDVYHNTSSDKGSVNTRTALSETDVSDSRSCTLFQLPPEIKMTVVTVNGKGHLAGLKRTRGVGSSQFDEGQKKIESFFKKTKVG